ncbi:hypothetical protein KQ51_01569 [Candidatus Izimaplasma bacterium HR1]|jgi:hypothetical protein|uniref:hypothetical protein n=1 Tax=Candidatus Izimoplasma sp. HR1 TaxID=1541959 RepID=UPI0004F815BD|nr:hypothetical protein KQ51_01569 [Candidatus Izimaplasma bacterium HR1]
MKNQKYLLIFGSIFIILLMIAFPVGILLSPSITPMELLSAKPYVEIGNLIIIVPSSTFIVYLLGAITIFFGIKLTKLEESYKKYWGISLILWGIGTVLAGTSYQGLGYMLKCDNQELCLFTSWFELSYLYVTALSITLMGYAVAKKSICVDKLNLYTKIIFIGFIGYTISLVLGIVFEIQLLITYEWFLLFFLPYFISFMVINVKGNKRSKNETDKGLINVWLIMLLINILYFAYFYSGLGELLYDDYSIWFSANDVLHVGLIPWMYYIYIVVKK